MCFHQPHHWKNWLVVVKWWYNTNFHTALQKSPFQVLHAYAPIRLSLESATPAVEIADDRMLDAQYRIKMEADSHRSEKNVAECDWV